MLLKSKHLAGSKWPICLSTEQVLQIANKAASGNIVSLKALSN
jgi:hypothetical protein